MFINVCEKCKRVKYIDINRYNGIRPVLCNCHEQQSPMLYEDEKMSIEEIIKKYCDPSEQRRIQTFL